MAALWTVDDPNELDDMAAAGSSSSLLGILVGSAKTFCCAYCICCMDGCLHFRFD